MSSSPPETVVRFKPFELFERRDKVLIGREGGADWIVVDPAHADVIAALDRGVPVEALDGAPALVRDLRSMGFVDAVGVPYSGSRRLEHGRPSPTPWAWRAFALTSIAAAAAVVWAFASGRTQAPAAPDLLAGGLPWPAAVAVLAGTLLLTGALHELAHVAVARHYGLRASVRVRPHVLRTSLDGVWALERSLRWRPVAAGMMLDVCVLAAAALAGAPWLVAALSVRLVWQLQVFHRTDLHFLYATLTGALNLREVTRLLLRRSPRVAGFPASEVRAARGYLLLLPFAGATTLALALWLVLGVTA
jgi:hypothetical protein